MQIGRVLPIRAVVPLGGIEGRSAVYAPFDSATRIVATCDVFEVVQIQLDFRLLFEIIFICTVVHWLPPVLMGGASSSLHERDSRCFRRFTTEGVPYCHPRFASIGDDVELAVGRDTSLRHDQEVAGNITVYALMPYRDSLQAVYAGNMDDFVSAHKLDPA